MLLLGALTLLALGGAAALDGLKGPPSSPLYLAPLRARAGDEQAQPLGFNLSAGLNLNEHGPFCFTQKISHFDAAQNGTFCQRYQVDRTHYRPGGPVILMDPGETPTMGDGSVAGDMKLEYHLAKAHGALVVTLEHRYYGYSYPAPDLSTDSLRWMTLDEALEDTAEFIRRFPAPAGLDGEALKPSATPWFYVGGSYPGARSAWTRARHPDLVWGAIASSPAPMAEKIENGLQDFFLAWAQWADPACVRNFEAVIASIDDLLDKGQQNQTIDDGIKDFWQARGLPNWRFAMDVQQVAAVWLNRVWSIDEDKDRFSGATFCRLMTAPAENFTIAGETVPGHMRTYRDWYLNFQGGELGRECGNETDILKCYNDRGDLWSLSVPPKTEIDVFSQERVWNYQMCNHFGLFVQGPPAGSPLPRLASKYLDRQHNIDLCHHWYPPGARHRLPDVIPDARELADKGGAGLSAPRIAWANGEWDPWLYMMKPVQESTPDNPYYLIPKGGHCWDLIAAEDLSTEPEWLQPVHRGLIADIGRWIQEFHEQCNTTAAQ